MDFSPYIYIFVVAVVAGVAVLIRSDARDFLENYSGAVGVVFAVIAGAFVLVEYNNGQRDKLLAQTLAYIERIESGSAHESRQWLDLHWMLNRELLAEIRSVNKRTDGEEDAKKLLESYSDSFNEEDPGLQTNIIHIMRLTHFYSDLSQCVELVFCDASTTCNIFADDISEFYVLHADFIQRWDEASFGRNFNTIKMFLNDTCGVG